MPFWWPKLPVVDFWEIDHAVINFCNCFAEKDQVKIGVWPNWHLKKKKRKICFIYLSPALSSLACVGGCLLIITLALFYFSSEDLGRYSNLIWLSHTHTRAHTHRLAIQLPLFIYFFFFFLKYLKSEVGKKEITFFPHFFQKKIFFFFIFLIPIWKQKLK